MPYRVQLLTPWITGSKDEECDVKGKRCCVMPHMVFNYRSLFRIVNTFSISEKKYCCVCVCVCVCGVLMCV